MKIKTLVRTNNEFENIINELITNETVLEMKNYRQHFDTSCFDHCYLAAYYCYFICKKFKLDYKSATRAAMLHDLFLYDWRDKNSHRPFHAFHHGKTACINACKLFTLNKKEQDIIIRHMWPVTLAFPNSIEGLILTFVDKYCALHESWQSVKSYIYSKKYFRHSYIFLTLFLLQIRQI